MIIDVLISYLNLMMDYLIVWMAWCEKPVSAALTCWCFPQPVSGCDHLRQICFTVGVLNSPLCYWWERGDWKKKEEKKKKDKAQLDNKWYHNVFPPHAPGLHANRKLEKFKIKRTLLKKHTPVSYHVWWNENKMLGHSVHTLCWQ